MRLKSLLLLLVCCYTLNAQCQEKQTQIDSVVIAVSDQNLFDKFHPIVSNAYASLGIRISYIETTWSRSSLLSQKKNIDAILIKGDSTAIPELNLTRINIPLSRYRQALLCSQSVVCDISVLDNPLTVVASPNSREAMVMLLKGKVAQTYHTKSVDTLIEMLKKDRFKYGIAYIVEGEESRFDGIQIAPDPLLSDTAYHYVTERLVPISGDIEKAIRNAIEGSD